MAKVVGKTNLNVKFSRDDLISVSKICLVLTV